ncbi:hypothetical protein HYS79_02220 [Patescibacteria group bacterium]|nr:hypothetical protein [Patescibacteria group bacterium]
MPKKDNSKPESKIGLGEKTDSGYKYSSRINFKEDLSLQIAKLMQEKKAKDELETYVEQIRKISSRFKNKDKNLDYYTAVGKVLFFLSSDSFKNIKPYSVFRRLIDEVPDILPGLDTKRIQDHLMMMYRIGGLDENILSKATWEQWYEISKFKNAINNRRVLNRILTASGSASGPDLRKKIESILGK